MASPSAGGEPPLKIVSGGQTGADRAALDWAIGRGLEHGGWCPRGRRAEDGAVPLQYRLTETPTERWEQRTEWNVRDSDATLIITVSETLTGGSLRTLELARTLGKPYLHLSRRLDGDLAGPKLRRFVADRLPADCTAEVQVFSTTPGIEVQADSPWVRAARTALTAEYGKPAVLMGCGGSIPVVESMQRLLGLDSLLVGFGLNDDLTMNVDVELGGDATRLVRGDVDR